MARSTAKSLAGPAARAAKMVIGRRAAVGSVAGEGAAAKAPAKKATAKATSAKKSPAKKAPAKKAPAKKTAAATAPAKKAPATKTPAKKAPTKTAKNTTARTTAPAKKSAGSRQTAAAQAAPTTKAAPVKKAPGKPVTPGSLVVLEGESPWTRAELKEVTDELHEHRERLTTLLDDAERELAGLMRDAGDGAGHDQADMGATSFERDHELTVVNNEREMLAQTTRALARIDDGTYGVCESCGEPIGKLRLMAFPRATLCLPCKQREERR